MNGTSHAGSSRLDKEMSEFDASRIKLPEEIKVDSREVQANISFCRENAKKNKSNFGEVFEEVAQGARKKVNESQNVYAVCREEILKQERVRSN